jgi:hypothetical protein
MLDLISTDINQEKKNKNPQTDKQKSKVLHKLSEQIGILTDVISRLNDKIKNQ